MGWLIFPPAVKGDDNSQGWDDISQMNYSQRDMPTREPVNHQLLPLTSAFILFDGEPDLPGCLFKNSGRTKNLLQMLEALWLHSVRTLLAEFHAHLLRGVSPIVFNGAYSQVCVDRTSAWCSTAGTVTDLLHYFAPIINTLPYVWGYRIMSLHHAAKEIRAENYLV